jgi:16S rRNA (cytosine1402-N4)-methyltransferase
MKSEENSIHASVMKTEIGQYLQPAGNGVYVDATLGFGGHTLEILERTDFSATVVCFEIDQDALAITSDMLSAYEDKLVFINQNFTKIEEVLGELNINEVDGVVADLGLSSFQLEQSGKGFSFQKDEFLDMRADSTADITAFDLINDLSAEQLSEMFWKYGEERFSRQIARAITKSREVKEISTTLQLCSVIESAVPSKFKPKRINCSTKVFQALRIAVNNELENLQIFLDKAIERLAKGGAIAVISFNSLEDKIVKNIFSRYSQPCTCPADLPICSCGRKPTLKLINKRAISPCQDEISINPRSRSARLRVAQKI